MPEELQKIIREELAAEDREADEESRFHSRALNWLTSCYDEDELNSNLF